MPRALEPPYSGPYQVLSRREKTSQILLRDRPVTVSTERAKPAYMLNETDSGTTTTFNYAVDATPSVAKPGVPPFPVDDIHARNLTYVSLALQHLRDHFRGE
jgi:hypothetical protein